MKWYYESGKLVSCHEKLKVLEQNLQELTLLGTSFEAIKNTRIFEDAVEDAVLFGISISHFEENLRKYLENKNI